MQRVVLLLFLCALAHSATTVAGTIKAPTGESVSGSCSIQALGFNAAGGTYVIGAPTIVKFTVGAFTAALQPTDAATPSGQYYRVTCTIPAQTVGTREIRGYTDARARTWVVPTSGSTLTIADVEVVDAPIPPSRYMRQTGAWSSSTTYKEQEVVQYLGASYVSLAGANIANQPDTATTWWRLLGGGGGSGSLSGVTWDGAVAITWDSLQ